MDYILDPHGPLGDLEIRVFDILPSVDDNAAIKCQLSRISFSEMTGEASLYEAISYVWGDVNDITPITCNKILFPVTVNLANALRRLRLETAPRRVWADAVCIDQSNNEEKSRQIPLMGRVYASASRVLIWLGHADILHSETASRWVRTIGEGCQEFLDNSGVLHPISYDFDRSQVPTFLIQEHEEVSLDLLFASPWFTRIWCVQELLRAKDTLMFWGKDEFSWSQVSLVTEWRFAIHHVKSYPGLDEDSENTPGFSYARAMIHLGSERRDLLALLHSGRKFKSEDPRDKVYGILALAIDQKCTESISVNYNKDVAETYADTVIASLKFDSLLTPLHYVSHGSEYRRITSFASWTPRWDLHDGFNRLLDDEWELSACKGIPIRSVDATNIDTRYLRLSGLMYSEVSNIAVHVLNEQNVDLAILSICDSFAELVDTRTSGSTEGLHVLARTLTAGTALDYCSLSSAHFDEQREFYSSAVSCFQPLQRPQNTSAEKNHPIRENKWFAVARFVCEQRRLFRTATGSIGLGPKCMRDGDIVVVLFGGHSPYILRPCGDGEYHYMGQAYVDGLMHGKLVDAMEAGELEEQQFCLI